MRRPDPDKLIALQHLLQSAEREAERARSAADQIDQEIRVLQTQDVLLQAVRDRDPAVCAMFVSEPTEGCGPDGTTWVMPLDELLPMPEAAVCLVDGIRTGRCDLLLADDIALAFWYDTEAKRLCAVGRPLTGDDATGHQWLLGSSLGPAARRTADVISPLVATITTDPTIAGRPQSLTDALHQVIARDRMVAAVTPTPVTADQQLRPSGLPHLRGVIAGDLLDDDGNVPPVDRLDWAAVAAVLAQPIWIGPELAAQLADSDPPDADVLASVRLPHRMQLVLASTPGPARPEDRWTVKVPWGGHATNPTWWATTTGEVSLPGVVLLTDDQGQLRYDAVVLLGLDLGDAFRTPEFVGDMVDWARTNRVGTAAFDAWASGNGMAMLHQVYVPDWRATLFAGHIARLAAAVGVCNEHGYDAATDQMPPGPARKVIRTSAFRKAARRGRYTRIRVIDLVRHRQPAADDATPSGRTVTPHLRRGHWRRVRCGHRDDWWYEPRWIPPTWVVGHGDSDPTAPMQVWRTVADDQRDGQVGGNSQQQQQQAAAPAA